MPLFAALALLHGCSDYGVSHSDLVAESESPEILLLEGEEKALLVRMIADAEAMEAKPSSYVRATVFAVAESGSPRLFASAAGQAADAGIAPTAFLELIVDEPFAGCDGDAPDGAPRADVRDDGSCEVEMPVMFTVEGGSVSLQLDAYVQLNFSRQKPPGELTVSVETEG